jgi:hypothetical protein
MKLFRYHITPYGAVLAQKDGSRPTGETISPMAGIAFEINAPIYGCVGYVWVEPSTDEKHITDGGLTVYFEAADKWFLRLMRRFVKDKYAGLPKTDPIPF